MSVVLPVPLAPTSETCSPRSSQISAPSSRTRPSPTSIRPPVISKTTRPVRSTVAELEAQLAVVAGIALDAIDLVHRLDPRLGLARLGRLVAEALHERLHPRDLRLLLVDRAAERHLARRRLAAPLRPGAGEEPPAARLELEDRGADGLQEPAVVRHHDDRRVEREQGLLQPLERLDVEVVRGLVEQEEVGMRPERAGERGARELAAGERGELAVEVVLGEAQAPHHAGGAVAPVPAAGVLESRLGARVGVHDLLVAVRHLHRELRQVLLERDELRRAGQDVVAQGEIALARRALVVQRDAGALLERELPDVDRRLTRQHAQERRLARPVAPGDGQPVAALELERDAAEQRRSRRCPSRDRRR